MTTRPGRWSVLLVAVLATGGLALLTLSPAATAAAPPVSGVEHAGDWVVNTPLTYTGAVLYIKGNVTIAKGGRLTLTDTVLQLNLSSTGQYGIAVRDGGNLDVKKSSGTSEIRTRPGETMWFRFDRGSGGNISGTSIVRVGFWGANPIRDYGLNIESSTVTIGPGVSFVGSGTNRPLQINSSSPKIQGNSFSGFEVAISLWNSSARINASTFSGNFRYAIQVTGGGKPTLELNTFGGDDADIYVEGDSSLVTKSNTITGGGNYGIWSAGGGGGGSAGTITMDGDRVSGKWMAVRLEGPHSLQATGVDLSNNSWGGLYVDCCTDRSVTIDTSKFNNNNEWGLYIANGDAGQARVTRSQFIGNYWSGGLQVYRGAFDVTDTLVQDSTEGYGLIAAQVRWFNATRLTVTRTGVDSFNSPEPGLYLSDVGGGTVRDSVMGTNAVWGAYVRQATNLLFDRVSFTDNNADTCYWGGSFCTGSRHLLVDDNRNLTIRDSTFSGGVDNGIEGSASGVTVVNTSVVGTQGWAINVGGSGRREPFVMDRVKVNSVGNGVNLGWNARATIRDSTVRGPGTALVVDEQTFAGPVISSNNLFNSSGGSAAYINYQGRLISTGDRFESAASGVLLDRFTDVVIRRGQINAANGPALELWNDGLALFEDSRLIAPTSPDIRFNGEGSVATLCNTTWTAADIAWTTSPGDPRFTPNEVRICFRARTSVEWQNGAAAAGALLTVTSRNGLGNVAFRGIVPASGSVGTLPLAHRTYINETLVQIIDEESYDFDATLNGVNGTIRATMDRDQDAVVQLTDGEKPAVAIATPADGTRTTNGTLTITGTAGDAISGLALVEVSTNGGVSWTPATGGKAWSLAASLPEGVHSIVARASDVAGNTATATVGITVDRSAPVLVVTEPEDGALVNTTGVTVTGMTELGALLTIDGVPRAFTGTDFSIDLPLQEGNNTIVVAARDATGNEASVTRTVTRDTIPPSLTTDLEDGFSTVAKVVVAGKSDGLTVTINGKDSPLTNGTYRTVLDLADGVATVVIVARDLAGNEASLRRAVTVDTKVPAVTVASLVGQGNLSEPFLTNNATVNLTGSVSEVVPRLEVVGGRSIPSATREFATTVTLPEGVSRLEVRATDAAGNTGMFGRTIIVDTTPPAIVLLSPAHSQRWNQATWLVRGRAEIGSTVTVNGANVTVDPQTGLFDHTWTLAQGANTVSATATDRAGNSATAGPVTVTVDSIAPKITVTTPSKEKTKTPQTSLKVKFSVDSASEVRVNGIVVTGAAGSYEHTVDLGPGRNQLLIEAVDDYGNAASATFTITQEATGVEVGGTGASIIGFVVALVVGLILGVLARLMGGGGRRREKAPPAEKLDLGKPAAGPRPPSVGDRADEADEKEEEESAREAGDEEEDDEDEGFVEEEKEAEKPPAKAAAPAPVKPEPAAPGKGEKKVAEKEADGGETEAKAAKMVEAPKEPAKAPEKVKAEDKESEAEMDLDSEIDEILKKV